MKKQLVLLLLMLLSGSLAFGQDVRFPPAIMSAGGSMAPTGAVNITRWRLAAVNVLTIGANVRSQDPAIDSDNPLALGEWAATVYPNPVGSLLKVRLQMSDPAALRFELMDVTGKKLFVRDRLLLVTGQQVEFNLDGFTPGFYLLKITSTDSGKSKVFRISKY